MQFYRISLPVRLLMTQMPTIDDDRVLSALRVDGSRARLRAGFGLKGA